MIRGLQITMRGEDLRNKIAERLKMHEEKVSALEARIRARDGDHPYDIRPDDGLESLGELMAERDDRQARAAQLRLLHEYLIVDEIYTLDRADLRAAELMVPDREQESESVETESASIQGPPIDGLKLTISGGELHRLLQDRVREHEECAARWTRDRDRTPEEETEDEPRVPDHMCANEAERHEWRADVLAFIRDHVESAETYRLGEADLAFGELLPEKPGWLEQEEYEEKTAVGFQLERLAKRFDTSGLRRVLAAESE